MKMSYCGGCGGGYCGNSGIEQIVQYAKPMFDQPAGEGQFNPQYQSGHMSETATAIPAYMDNIDNMIGNAYTINLDRPAEVISVGGSPTGNYANKDYDNNPVSENYNNTKPTKENVAISVTPFINPDVQTKFIGEVDDIKEHIKETFTKVTGKELPNDFTIEVCDDEKLRRMHDQFGGDWSNGIQGFAINKKHLNQPSHIFVRKGQLAHVMVVIGHELGHIQSHTLMNKHDEEAKAYAFEMAWIKTIHDHNIAGLRDAIRIDGTPAENGLHNIAFDFIQRTMQEGIEAMDVFRRLISGDITTSYDFSVSLM